MMLCSSSQTSLLCNLEEPKVGQGNCLYCFSGKMSKKRKKEQQKGGKPAKQKQADGKDTSGDGLMNTLVAKLANFVTGRGRYVVSCRGYLHC
jgi:hypothetical protein